MTIPYLLLVVAIMSAITFSLRAFPFVVLSKFKDSQVVLYLGRTLPPSIMLILVVYCLKDVSFNATPYGVPELVSILIVAALHLYKRNVLLSVGGGIFAFALLTHWLVVPI